MRILGSTKNYDSPKSSAVAIGIFDGVHRGHQVLLGKVKELAAEHDLESIAYTFDPHPAVLLVPTRAPRLIEPIATRLERFEALHVDAALIERFSVAFAATPPEEFVDRILLHDLRARHVVVGAGFTFGAGGKGTTELLRARATAAGAVIHVVEPVIIDGERVSSTRIRTAVSDGDVRAAATLLGRPFALYGLVMRGARRGQALGFGTANLAPENELRPKNGVYACRVTGRIGSFQSVVNVGTTPTFGAGGLKIEAHLLDFDGHELYGTALAIEFLARLRDEQKFADVAALKAQIQRDIETAVALPDWGASSPSAAR